MAGNIFFIIKDFYWLALLPVALFIILLFFFSLDKVLYLIVFTTPLAVNLQNYDQQLSLSLPTEPLLFAVMLIFFIKLIFERKYDWQILKHPVSISILIYLLWMLITSITSEIPLVSLKFLVAKLWFIIPFYFIIIILFKKIKSIRTLAWLYAIPLAIVIIYSSYRLYIWGFDENAAHWVMDPFYNDHTAYGAAISFFVPVFAGLLFDKSYTNSQKLFTAIIFLILVMGLFLSYSRAAWISVVLSFGIALILLLKIKFKWVLLIFLLFIGLFFYFKEDILWKLEKNKQDSSVNFVEHVESISNISSDASNLERINRWQSAIRMFEQRPFFGWGPGTYQFIYAPFQKSQDKTIISTNAGDMGTAHSEYIGPLSESGIFGSLSFISIVFIISYTAIRVFKRTRLREVKLLVLIFFVGLVTYFIHGILNNFLDSDKCSIPFWSFAAVIVALDIYHKSPITSGDTLPEDSERK